MLMFERKSEDRSYYWPQFGVRRMSRVANIRAAVKVHHGVTSSWEFQHRTSNPGTCS